MTETETLSDSMVRALRLIEKKNVLPTEAGIHHKTVDALVERGLAKQLKSGLLTSTAKGRKAVGK